MMLNTFHVVFDTYISFGKEPVQILAYIFIGWFVFFFMFNWKIIALKCCVGFAVQQHESALSKHISLPLELFLHPPLGCHRAPG